MTTTTDAPDLGIDDQIDTDDWPDPSALGTTDCHRCGGGIVSSPFTSVSARQKAYCDTCWWDLPGRVRKKRAEALGEQRR